MTVLFFVQFMSFISFVLITSAKLRTFIELTNSFSLKRDRSFPIVERISPLKGTATAADLGLLLQYFANKVRRYATCLNKNEENRNTCVSIYKG